VLLVGGTFGVFRTVNPVGAPGGVPTPNASLNWAEFGTGLPNAIVSDLRYTPKVTYGGLPTGDVLAVATMGRGVYEIKDAAALAASAGTLSITGSSAKVSAIEVRQDATNPTLIEVRVDGVSTGPRYQQNTLQNIDIRNRVKADTIVIDGRMRVTDQINVIGDGTSASTKILSLTVDAKSIEQWNSPVGGVIRLTMARAKLT
jgi:hypothetical protein